MFTPHNPPSIFEPAGPYTHGLEVVGAKRLLFISGTLGLDPNGRVPEGFEAQCRQAWQNIVAILASAGMTCGNLVKVNGFLASAEFRLANAAIRSEFLGDHRVTSTVIVAALLDTAWLLEIEAIAAA